MSAEMRELTTRPVLWLITIGAIALVWFLAYFCIARSRRAAKQLGMSQDMVNMTVKASVNLLDRAVHRHCNRDDLPVTVLNEFFD